MSVSLYYEILLDYIWGLNNVMYTFIFMCLCHICSYFSYHLIITLIATGRIQINKVYLKLLR